MAVTINLPERTGEGITDIEAAEAAALAAIEAQETLSVAAVADAVGVNIAAAEAAPDGEIYVAIQAGVAAIEAAEDDALDAIADAQNAAMIRYETWTGLAAVTGTVDGQGAKCFAASGTHTDPVVGGTVDDRGVYRWSASPAGWKRIANLEADDAEAFADAAEASATAADASADEAQVAASAMATAFLRPNIFIDPEFLGQPASGAVKRVVTAGLATLVVEAGSVEWRMPADQFESTFSVSIWRESLVRVNNNTKQLFIRQYDAANAEIVASRVSLINNTDPGTTTPTRLSSAGIAKHADAVEVSLYVSMTGAGNILTLSRPSFASGGQAVDQPPVPNYLATATDLDDLRTGLAREGLEPNVFPDPDFIELPPRTSNPATWLVASGSAPTVGEIDGRTTVIVTNSDIYIRMPAYLFGGPGGEAAFSLVIERLERSSGSLSVFVRQMNAAGSEISSTIRSRLLRATTANLGGAIRRAGTLTLHADCAFLDLYLLASGHADNEMEVSQITFSRGSSPAWRPARRLEHTVYVDPTSGSDNNSGAYASPFVSIPRALAALKRSDRMLSGKILLKEGDFAAGSFPLGNLFDGGQPYAVDLVVEALACARVRMMHGTLLTSITKTGGRTNVYQAAHAATPTAKFMFEHETPEGSITAAERHPLHQGLAYRSPSTRMRKAADLTACDATPGTWFFSSGVVYFHPLGSTDPTSSGETYYVPSNVSSTNAGAVGWGIKNITGHTEFRGIEAWYGFNGFAMNNGASFVLDRCVSVGSSGTGIAAGYGKGDIIACRSIASGVDGCGLALSASDAQAATFADPYIRVIDFYGAMNGDDGLSPHARMNGAMWGGLLEYNDDSGFAVAIGGEWSAFGTYARKNGQQVGIDGAVGEGFGLRQAPTGDEGGYGNSFVGHDLIADGNVLNFSAGGEATNTMELFRPISLNATSLGYWATGSSVSRLVGATSSGDATAKAGTHTVVTPAAVT